MYTNYCMLQTICSKGRVLCHYTPRKQSLEGVYRNQLVRPSVHTNLVIASPPSWFVGTLSNLVYY